MWLIAILNHLFNFVLPAFWLASTLLLAHRLLHRSAQGRVRWGRHWLWLFASGVAILLAGLLVSGQDGKMGTYVVLVAGVGAVQAWLVKKPFYKQDVTAPGEPFQS